MRNRKKLLDSVYDRLFEALGPQHWWPADSPFEVVLGAILTQNTAWTNVVKAISNLRENGLLSFGNLCALPLPQLAQLIRPSGFYNQKAIKIRTLCDHVIARWDGSLERMFSLETEALRNELLTIRGVGPETADSIVLYAAQKPSFVVDAYTCRIFSRHGWVEESIPYGELRDFFMGALDEDIALFQEYHALLVRTGRLFCRRKPRCDLCPLKVFFDA